MTVSCGNVCGSLSPRKTPISHFREKNVGGDMAAKLKGLPKQSFSDRIQPWRKISSKWSSVI